MLRVVHKYWSYKDFIFFTYLLTYLRQCLPELLWLAQNSYKSNCQCQSVGIKGILPQHPANLNFLKVDSWLSQNLYLSIGPPTLFLTFPFVFETGFIFTQYGLELTMQLKMTFHFQPLLPKCWNYNCVSPYPVCKVLGIKPRNFHMLGKHSLPMRHISNPKIDIKTQNNAHIRVPKLEDSLGSTVDHTTSRQF